MILDAIPALRTALDAPFTIELVGPDEPHGTPGARALADCLQTADLPEVRQHGRISEDALGRFYLQIDVLVLPSVDRIEAYGMMQVEAMMHGTPCVTSDRPGMREPIGLTGFGALFRPGSAEGLASAVQQVLTSGPLQVPTPLQVRAMFDPAKIFSQIKVLYAEVLG